ncbi:hypothetical protein LCGC14_2068550 [marine sediment metagenome]|uniref:Glycosyl transferase n=1 Tax=marine sediment metagenome TaxID=412755 RepID=A0A0F9EIZ5_9ZZZZ
MYWLLQQAKRFIKNYLGNEIFIAEHFKKPFGRPINLLRPQTFNEKIQVLKLYDKNPLMTELVDKFRVREYIECIGYGDILNELFQECESPEDIDFDALPEKFVIKCNHSWNTNIICEDKLALDQHSAKNKLGNWLRYNHYLTFREWAYRDIKPKIIIERHLAGELRDFKIFCFNGAPQFVQVDSERFGHHTLDVYDMEWNRLDMGKGNQKVSATSVKRSAHLEKMEKIARDISANFIFCRVDFLATADNFYFGEATFYPGGGFSPFQPERFDYIFGEHLNLTSLKKPGDLVFKQFFLTILGRAGFI